MSEQKDEERLSLVDEVDEKISTDAITDLKTGIYNLYLNLFHNLVVFYGPEEALRQANNFLQEIIDNFSSAIESDK